MPKQDEQEQEPKAVEAEGAAPEETTQQAELLDLPAQQQLRDKLKRLYNVR